MSDTTTDAVTAEDAETECLDSLEIVREQFRRARSHLQEFKQGLIEFFDSPKRSIAVCFPVQMDDGSIRSFHGYRVLHNTVRDGHVDLRTSDLILAIRRVAAITLERGIWP